MAWFALGFAVLWLHNLIHGRKLMSLNEDLRGIKTALSKAKAEIVGKLTDLQAQLENAPEKVDPALVEEIKGLAQSLDDIVPDAPIVDEPPAEA